MQRYATCVCIRMTCVLQADDVAAPGESQPSHMAGVLVAKQQEERKLKGLTKLDEQREQFLCICVCVKPTDKSSDVIICCFILRSSL